MKNEGFDADRAVRQYWNKGLDSTVRSFVEKYHISADVASIAGGVLGVSAGACTYYDRPKAGFTCLAGSYLLDATDGWLARVNGGGTTVGEFLDSSLDRVVDWSVLTGIAKYAERRNWHYPQKFAQILREISPRVSYGRLVAEKYDVAIPQLDLGSRLTRSAALAVCLAKPDEQIWTGALGAAMIGANITNFQRENAVYSNRARIVTEALEDPIRMFSSQEQAYQAGYQLGDILSLDQGAVGTLGLICNYLSEKYRLVTEKTTSIS